MVEEASPIPPTTTPTSSLPTSSITILDVLTDRIPIHALYIDPPLAQVGMNERQVRGARETCAHGEFGKVATIGRAIEKGETQGFMKVTRRCGNPRDSRRAPFLVSGATEAIHCIATAMYARQPAAVLARSVHIHPTVAELIPAVFQDLEPLAP